MDCFAQPSVVLQILHSRCKPAFTLGQVSSLYHPLECLFGFSKGWAVLGNHETICIDRFTFRRISSVIVAVELQMDGGTV